MPDVLRERDGCVQTLGVAIVDGADGLRVVPALLKRTIQDDCWRDRIIIKTGERVQFGSFADFVTTKPLKGLGATVAQLEALIKDDAEALTLFRRAITPTAGKPSRKGEVINANIINKPTQGTTRAYTLDRLQREAPLLYRDVIARKLSANAAAVKAGFRQKTITVPATVEGFERAIRQHFTSAQILGLLKRLATK